MCSQQALFINVLEMINFKKIPRKAFNKLVALTLDTFLNIHTPAFKHSKVSMHATIAILRYLDIFVTEEP